MCKIYDKAAFDGCMKQKGKLFLYKPLVMPHTDFDSRLSIFFRFVFVSFFSFAIVKIPFVEGERKVFLISQTLFSISHFEASVKL